jgi:hypothetical protein
LQATQQNNAEMMEKILAQRFEMERLVTGLEDLVKDIEGSVEAMGAGSSNGVPGLRHDIWQMEHEVQATR